MKDLKRVVITGLGALTPIGNNIEEYFNSLENGVSGCQMIKQFNADKFKTRFACELKNFNAEDYIDKKELKRLDPFTQYAIVAAKEAVEDSGILDSDVNKDDIGVIISSGIGGFQTIQSEIINFTRKDFTPRFSPFFIPKLIGDIAAGHISIQYGFKGPNFCTVSACASSTNAIIDAANYIRLGMANAFVVGGAEAAICEAGIGGFSSMQAISKNNDEFETASRPFDQSRDGFVMGEGSGMLIFEEYEQAKARGAKIYAEVVGTGMTADAYHLTAPHPEGEGAERVMRNAIKDAGISTDDIDYVNTHGTATPLGDIAETKALVKLFGEHVYDLNISSTKSMTGHLLGAAGAIEALAAVLAVTKDIIPPTINLKNVDSQIDQKLNLTPNKAQKRTVNYALSNTFGFGGHNASVVIKKYVE